MGEMFELFLYFYIELNFEYAFDGEGVRNMAIRALVY